MSKVKRFGLSSAMTQGLRESIQIVESDEGLFRNTVVPLTRIELDPANPRKLHFDLEDAKNGLDKKGPLYDIKTAEFKKLTELADSIKKSGLINPVTVFKRDEKYRIIAGERRCLASIIAGKTAIEARVFNTQPNSFELKLIQWFENTSREDLTLSERLSNLRDLVDGYGKENISTDITGQVIHQITGLSVQQATSYLAVLKTDPAVLSKLQAANVQNLDKAALLARISDESLRDRAIQACANGSSLKELRKIALEKQNKEVLENKKTVGRKPTKVNMGTTNHPRVVKYLVDLVLNQSPFEAVHAQFKEINWDDLAQAAKGFKRLVSLIEEKVSA